MNDHMSNLVVTVSDTSSIGLQQWTSLTLAGIITLISAILLESLELGKYYSYTVVLIFICSIGIADILVRPFIKKNTKLTEPQAILTISNEGIHIVRNRDKPSHIKWNDVVCLDIYHQAEQRQSLRVSPRKSVFKKIQFEEKLLNIPCKEILAFVHEVCPYGKDISLWDENRA